MRGAPAAAGRDRAGAVLDPGQRRRPGGADRRHRAPADAAARPRRHGDRALLPRAAAPRRRPAVRPRHGRHEGRRGAGARGGAGAGAAARDVRRADACCSSPTRSGAGTSSATSSGSPVLRRLPVLRGRASSPPTGTRAWSSAARPRERCGWSRPAAPSHRAAPPTRAATRCWRSRRPRSRSRGTTTRAAPSGSAWSRPSCARATRSTSCRPRASCCSTCAPDRSEAFEPCARRCPASSTASASRREMRRMWPGMDSREATRDAARARRRAARAPDHRRPRGGASDASHFAPRIPLTVDGLGPRGGGAHTPEEFVLRAVAARRGRRWRWRSRPRCSTILSRDASTARCQAPAILNHVSTTVPTPTTPPRARRAPRARGVRAQLEGVALLVGVVVLMWLIEGINTLDSQRPRQRRDPCPQHRSLWGDLHRAVPPRELAAPDREHGPVRVHGADHRAAGSRATGAGDADRDRRSAGSGPGWSRRPRDRVPSTRSAPAASCSATPPTCSRGASSTAASLELLIGAGRRGGLGRRAAVERRARTRASPGRGTCAARSAASSPPSAAPATSGLARRLRAKPQTPLDRLLAGSVAHASPPSQLWVA